MTNENWAPARIWLQRDVIAEGEHTWCEDSQDEHEQAKYVRVDATASTADAPVDAGGREWITELRRAHKYLDEGRPFFSGKDCAELAEFIEALASPAALQPSEANPVYQVSYSDDDGWFDAHKLVYDSHPDHVRRILYTAPPVEQREALTDQDIFRIASQHLEMGDLLRSMRTDRIYGEVQVVPFARALLRASSATASDKEGQS